MAFTCKRCGHSATTKGNLIQHLRSKRTCSAKNDDVPREELIEELQKREYKTDTTNCSFCKKLLSKSQIARHRKTCPKKHEVIQITTKELEQLTQKIKNDIINEIRQQPQLVCTTNNGTINNTTINNTYNLQLNSFGNENTTYLPSELLTYCLSNPKKGISYLIEQIHYNKDYPENHNLRCKSLKNNIFERFVDTKWTLCDASNTLDELIRKGYRILEAHFAETFLSDPYFFDDENRVENMQRFRQVLNDKKSNDYHSVKRDLRLLVKDKTMYVLEFVEPMENDTPSTFDG